MRGNRVTTANEPATPRPQHEQEGIAWSHIEYQDNAPTLALIEGKMGIIAVLNEECLRPKGNDAAFCSKLITLQSSHPGFSKPRISEGKQFIVHHYAGKITYTTDGWLDRNNDTMSDDIAACLREGANPLVARLFALPQQAAGGAPASDQRRGTQRATVATKFRASLTSLMKDISTTQTQYICRPGVRGRENRFC